VRIYRFFGSAEKHFSEILSLKMNLIGAAHSWRWLDGMNSVQTTASYFSLARYRAHSNFPPVASGLTFSLSHGSFQFHMYALETWMWNQVLLFMKRV
jgi:hypothetical protein